MDGVVDVYIQKGGTGTWLALPAGKNDFQKAINKVGVADLSDMTISHYKVYIAAIPTELLINADLNHVNYLAARLAGMERKQLDELDAIMESSFHFTTVEQLIDYTFNADYYLFRPGITETAALGRYYVFETGLCQMPEEWKNGIDLDKFGAHAAQQERGDFTLKGYIMPSGDKWNNKLAEYGIPDEYRIYKEK